MRAVIQDARISEVNFIYHVHVPFPPFTKFKQNLSLKYYVKKLVVNKNV